MKKEVLLILNAIQDEGYDAYVVGGFVRDHIMLSVNSHDIDITTNAPVHVLKNIFHDYAPKEFKYGTIRIKSNEDNFDIAHYRKEELIDGKLHVEFTDSLFEDSNRRDFTINAIYQDANGSFTDFHNGLEDLKNMTLSFIGNPITRLDEDPSRILRYIYLLIRFDLNYVPSEFSLIKDKIRFYLEKCSLYDINKYFVKIFDTSNIGKMVDLLHDFDVYDFFFNNEVYDKTITVNELLNDSGYKFYSELPNRFKK